MPTWFFYSIPLIQYNLFTKALRQITAVVPNLGYAFQGYARFKSDAYLSNTVFTFENLSYQSHFIVILAVKVDTVKKAIILDLSFFYNFQKNVTLFWGMQVSILMFGVGEHKIIENHWFKAYGLFFQGLFSFQNPSSGHQTIPKQLFLFRVFLGNVAII